MECSNCKTTYFSNKGCGAVVHKGNEKYSCCPCSQHCRPVAEIKWVPN